MNSFMELCLLGPKFVRLSSYHLIYQDTIYIPELYHHHLFWQVPEGPGGYLYVARFTDLSGNYLMPKRSTISVIPNKTGEQWNNGSANVATRPLQPSRTPFRHSLLSALKHSFRHSNAQSISQSCLQSVSTQPAAGVPRRVTPSHSFGARTSFREAFCILQNSLTIRATGTG